MKPCSKPEYEEEYPKSYGSLNFKGKTVVDIGADVGSSAEYFLKRGAMGVICYEKDPRLFASLQENARGDDRVLCFQEWDGAVLRCDILKVDCEGCETLLTEKHFEGVEQFAVALHPNMIERREYERLKGLIARFGGKLAFTTPDKQEEMYVRTQE